MSIKTTKQIIEEMRDQSEKNGNSQMTLDDINNEIQSSRIKKKYEYSVEHYFGNYYNSEELTNVLNKKGELGWKLVTMIEGPRFIFIKEL